MTGLLSCLHIVTILCCMEGTCSRGICAPKSPLAIIIPSDAQIISSRFFKASMLSIFAMTPISLGQTMKQSQLRQPNNSLQIKTSRAWYLSPYDGHSAHLNQGIQTCYSFAQPNCQCANYQPNHVKTKKGRFLTPVQTQEFVNYMHQHLSSYHPNLEIMTCKHLLSVLDITT